MAVRVGAARLEAAGVKVVGGGGGGRRKNGAVWVKAVQGGGGPGGGGPGWGRSGWRRSGWEPKFRVFFFLSRPFFQLLLKLFRFFSWPCEGGFGRFDFPKLCKTHKFGGGGSGAGCPGQGGPGQEGTRLGRSRAGVTGLKNVASRTKVA